MDAGVLRAELEAAVNRQMAFAGGDLAMTRAGEVLLQVLDPAIDAAVIKLAEQAAAEVGAQLPGAAVRVVMSDGEPTLRVEDGPETELPDDDVEARVTVRLPGHLKELIEAAAMDAGDSINSYVVRSLSRTSRRANRRGRYSGTIES